VRQFQVQAKKWLTLAKSPGKKHNATSKRSDVEEKDISNCRAE
jgi:hypothetical protein